jgi:hypothetical protein
MPVTHVLRSHNIVQFLKNLAAGYRAQICLRLILSRTSVPVIYAAGDTQA